MGEEKKDDGVGYPIKICSRFRQRNKMMDNFAQILRWVPTGEASSSSGHANPFKVQVNFDIPLFEGLIDVDFVDKWLNLLEGYFSVHNFSNRENINFSLLKVIPHVKDWWDTYSEKMAMEESEIFWFPLHGIPSETPLKNNTTMLEDMRTSTPDGPPCMKKGTRHYQVSPIFSIPYAPNWVSKTLRDIWCSNTMVVCIDTFKHKWSF
jgi:hypothetical protein